MQATRRMSIAYLVDPRDEHPSLLTEGAADLIRRADALSEAGEPDCGSLLLDESTEEEKAPVTQHFLIEKAGREGRRSTKAGRLGKSTGRWTKAEHEKFLQGTCAALSFELRPEEVREKLETSRSVHRDAHGNIDPKPRPEVL